MNNELDKAAHHEAGHILITYFTGYTCEKVVLNANANGDACTVQNYGDDLILITAITNSKIMPEMFNGLPKEIKKFTPVVAHKAANVLLAGPVCESIYMNNGIIDGNMSVDLSGEDLIRVEQIDFLLKTIFPQHDPNFIQVLMTDLFTFFSHYEFEMATAALVSGMKTAPNYTMDRKEIETILKKTGYLDFLATL